MLNEIKEEKRVEFEWYHNKKEYDMKRNKTNEEKKNS